MRAIELGYGHGSVSFVYDEQRYQIISRPVDTEWPLSDAEIGAALDTPIESPPLEGVVSPRESVLIVVSDATRATGSAQIVNLLVRRLIQIGLSPQDIAIIFATGIHRPVTPDEKLELLTPFICQRIRTIAHDPYDATGLTNLGVTARGTPVEVNRALKEYSHIIVTGAIGFHYFAGFSGGRKAICPGLASARTTEATHMLALDFEHGGRRAGVGTGLLDGNAVHEACESIAGMIKPSFGINTVVDERGRPVRVYAGDWRIAHRAGCLEYLEDHSFRLNSKRRLVIVSCGGSPYDINLIQAHKALDMAAFACEEGGVIVLLAKCRDGFGRSDFLKWFEVKDSSSLEKRLRSEYEVNGQTAWALLTKAERYRIYLVSDLADKDVTKMRLIPARTLADVMAQIDQRPDGYILPRGAVLLPSLED